MVDDRDKKTDYDFATAGESAPGRMATGHMSAEHGQSGTTKKDKERNADSTADLLQQLNDFRQQLCAQIDMFQALLDDLYEERSILDAQITALENMLSEYRENGAFQLGPDGYPADPTAKSAILAWEQKSGGKFDPESDMVNEFLRLGIVEFQSNRDGVELSIATTTEKLLESYEALNDLGDLNEDAKIEGADLGPIQEKLVAIAGCIETINTPNTQQITYETSLDLKLPGFN